MNSSKFSLENQIKTVNEGNRHVVILGAGASRASCLNNPEKNGKHLPLMNDFVNILQLNNLLIDYIHQFGDQKFELLFSKIYENNNEELALKVESKIYDYFQNLQLPNSPTIYDYLVLSLRKKDLIATFNWDPFLLQAYRRSVSVTNNLPQLAFLHGNVMVGFDDKTSTSGTSGTICSRSGELFQPSKLLYPIEKKDYNETLFLKNQWGLLSTFLKSNPAILTIFGYSAPKTDKEAIEIMQTAWGETKMLHTFNQIEIIDVQSKDYLKKSWDYFIHSHHYETCTNYFDSMLAKYPRRTGEIYKAQYIDALFCDDNKIPKFSNMRIFHNWFYSLISNE